MNFDFNDSTPLYQQIADQLEEMIFSGGFDEGSQVPSTTQLSQQLHINPATVLKGMNILVNKVVMKFFLHKCFIFCLKIVKKK